MENDDQPPRQPLTADARPGSEADRGPGEGARLSAFFKSILDPSENMKTLTSGSSREDCEIDVGTRWPREAWDPSKDDWKPDVQASRKLPEGEIEPIGYSFEVMIRDQYLLQYRKSKGKDGQYVCIRRRRGVLSPMAITEDAG